MKEQKIEILNQIQYISMNGYNEEMNSQTKTFNEIFELIFTLFHNTLVSLSLHNTVSDNNSIR